MTTTTTTTPPRAYDEQANTVTTGEYVVDVSSRYDEGNVLLVVITTTADRFDYTNDDIVSELRNIQATTERLLGNIQAGNHAGNAPSTDKLTQLLAERSSLAVNLRQLAHIAHRTSPTTTTKA